MFLLVMPVAAVMQAAAMSHADVSRLISKGKELLAETQMKETELAAKYRQEIMNRTIEQKSRELATASMSLTSRNSLIEELLRKYQAYREAGTEPDWHELVNSLRLFLKTADEHDRFLINFEAVHLGLLTRIKERHPNLSE